MKGEGEVKKMMGEAGMMVGEGSSTSGGGGGGGSMSTKKRRGRTGVDDVSA